MPVQPLHGLPYRFLMEMLYEQAVRQYSDANIFGR